MNSSFNQTLEEDYSVEAEKRSIKNRNLNKRLTELTKDLSGCRLNGSAIEYINSEEEIV